jgi:acyl-CoA thioester hydrolase
MGYKTVNAKSRLVVSARDGGFPTAARVGRAAGVVGTIDEPYQGAWLEGTHHFALRVYFEDTDVAGIVYYANYLKFMERARSDMLRSAGIDQRSVLEASGGVYVVAEANIKYRRPAKLDDALLLLSTVREVRAASCIIHQRVMRASELLAEATITAAFLSRAGRPQRQPREWMETFERLKKEGC